MSIESRLLEEMYQEECNFLESEMYMIENIDYARMKYELSNINHNIQPKENINQINIL